MLFRLVEVYVGPEQQERSGFRSVLPCPAKHALLASDGTLQPQFFDEHLTWHHKNTIILWGSGIGIPF